MKIIFPFLFLLFSVGSLWGQKHAFGIKGGVQFPLIPAQSIQIGDQVVNFYKNEIPRAYLGVSYQHQLTDRFFLNLSPTIIQEDYRDFTLGTGKSRVLGHIRNAILYLPASVYVDIGQQLFFTLGVGGNIYLAKDNRVRDYNYKLLNVEAGEILQDLFDQINPFALSMEAGLSYSFGRGSINGKFVYTLSGTKTLITTQDQVANSRFNTSYLQAGFSYRLGKNQAL